MTVPVDGDPLRIFRYTIRPADFKGQVVWLCIWRVGSPEGRDEVRYLPSLHEKAADKGSAIVGVHVADDRRIAQTFLRDEGILFPCVLDSSREAEKLFAEGYGVKFDSPPVGFVIGADGKVADAWSGFDGNHARGMAALHEAGVSDVGR